MNDKTLTKYEYRYSVEDYNGDEYEDSSILKSYVLYDLKDQNDRECFVKLAAEEYYHESGWENRSWTSNSSSLKFCIWLDKDTKYFYDVWCEFTPHFNIERFFKSNS